jgi:very-short-patch-repair endonuclease
MAAVLACGPGAVLSHRSAGQLWELVPRTPIEPEVTRPRAFRGLEGIRAHRALLPPDEVGALLGIPVTSAPRTQFDLASVLSPHQVERSFNEMEVQRLTDPLSIGDLIERHPRHRGVATLRAVMAAGASGVTRRGLEERFAALLDAHGLPRPRFKATLPVRGRLLEVDCMWRAERLIVELDSSTVHGTRRAFESDRQRDRILLVEGWRSTRVTWRQLQCEADEVVADLRRLLTTRLGEVSR